MLNKAYMTLKSPLSRAQYLISQHLEIPNEEGEMVEDETLISEILNSREEIEDAEGEEELNRILKDNQGESRTFPSRLESPSDLVHRADQFSSGKTR